MSFPKILGHRGAPFIAPENTMASFRTAVNIGVDGIETDVQETKDGELVICHDEMLNRTTNGTGLLKDYTLKELKELSAGFYYSEKFKEEEIPTLREFLEFVSSKDILVNIEIKSGVILYPNIEKKVIEMLHEFNMGHRTIISNFNHYSLLTCKEIDSSIKTGALYMCGLIEPWKYALQNGIDALHPFFYNIRPEIMGGIKESKIMVNPFTVDEEAHMRYMAAMGVDGIITNRPDRLISIKNEGVKVNEA